MYIQEDMRGHGRGKIQTNYAKRGPRSWLREAHKSKQARQTEKDRTEQNKNKHGGGTDTSEKEKKKKGERHLSHQHNVTQCLNANDHMWGEGSVWGWLAPRDIRTV